MTKEDTKSVENEIKVHFNAVRLFFNYRANQLTVHNRTMSHSAEYNIFSLNKFKKSHNSSQKSL